MEAQDYPVAHFQEMTALAEALKALPAQVLEHKYSYETFGSWFTIFQYKGRTFQLTYEGRDFEYLLRKCVSRGYPYEWGPYLWQHAQAADEALNISEFVTALKAGYAAK